MILHLILTTLTFLLMISLLVAAHELGHYLFARLFGMGVEEFAIGMGGKPWIWKRRTYTIPIKEGDDPYKVSSNGGNGLEGASLISDAAYEPDIVDTPEGKAIRETTSFSIRPFPVGGFVRIKGMVPEEDGSEVKIVGGFYNKAPWKRLVVLFAGPAFSVITGILILTAIYCSNGIYKANNVVKDVSANSAADGLLLPKDRIIRVNDHVIASHYDLISNVRDMAGKKLTLGVIREGKEIEVKIVPTLSENEEPVFDKEMMPTGEQRRQGRLGILPDSDRLPVSFVGALSEASLTPVRVVQGLASMVSRPKRLKENVGGPISMVTQTSQAVNRGPVDVIALCSLLSISVGIFNLLPIYPLDGGQMVVAFAEMFRGGRRLSFKMQNAVGVLGLATILLMVLSVSALDIGKLRENKPEPKFKSAIKPDASKPK